MADSSVQTGESAFFYSAPLKCLRKNASVQIVFCKHNRRGQTMSSSRMSLYRLIVGLDDVSEMVVEESFVVTAELVNAALLLAVDSNMLHRDEQLARSLGFEGVVAPGSLLDAMLSGFVARNFPDGIVAKSKEVNFKRACYVGGLVEMHLWLIGKIVDSQGNETLNLGFDLKNQRNKTLIDGTCSIIVLKKLRDQLGAALLRYVSVAQKPDLSGFFCCALVSFQIKESLAI